MSTVKTKEKVKETSLKKVPEKDIELLFQLYKIQSPSRHEETMILFLKQHISRIPGISFKSDKIGNILVSKGKLNEGEYYPCIVAHMDTVHDAKEGIVVHSEKTKKNETKLYVTMKDSDAKGEIKEYYHGGAGDDRNGIWLVLEMLREFDTIKVIFTVQEEIGAIGADAIDQTFLADIGYYIEGDRKGSSDIITSYFGSSMVSDEFDEVIKKVGVLYGYKESDGLFTDVCTLYEMNEASAINISVGYYNAHTDQEYTILEELENALDYTKALVTLLGKLKYKVDVIPYKYKSYKNNNKYFGDIYDEDFYWESNASNSKEKELECFSHTDETAQGLVDIECITCNPLESDSSGYYCGCGEELQKRKYSLFCPICQTHKIKDYEY